MAMDLGRLAGQARPGKGQDVGGHPVPHISGTNEAERSFAASVGEIVPVTEDIVDETTRDYWSWRTMIDITEQRQRTIS